MIPGFKVRRWPDNCFIIEVVWNERTEYDRDVSSVIIRQMVCKSTCVPKVVALN